MARRAGGINCSGFLLSGAGFAVGGALGIGRRCSSHFMLQLFLPGWEDRFSRHNFLASARFYVRRLPDAVWLATGEAAARLDPVEALARVILLTSL